MRAPIRLVRGGWPAPLENQLARFVWADPAVIADADVSAADFRTAMSAIHVGETIKITGADRHPEADSLLLDHLDLTEATILDIGASDGSTSVDLIAKLPAFRAFVIADLFFTITAVRVKGHVVFFDQNDAAILVVGTRLVAWPVLSPGVARVYAPLVAAARKAPGPREQVLLLNPDARRLVASDPRVTYAVHDVFTPWQGQTPDVIKVANLLRRLYFDDARIIVALQALMASLPEGGHLLIIDNPRIEGSGPRGGLFRRAGDRFEAVALTPDEPEILDLVMAVRLTPPAG